MFRTVLPLVLLLVQTPAQGLVVPAFSPPTRTAAAPSPEELAAIRAGVALYDQGKFDDAIAKFEPVLKSNPDCAMAMHELAMTYMAKKDYQRAIDLAAKGTAYQAAPTVLAQYYTLIGNALDEAREPMKAVAVYTKGLEVAPAVSLYYNMGVTYAQSLADVPNAKTSLKNGARLDPAHAGTQMMLGRLFLMDDLKAPALLALSRFLILEPASARTGDAYQMWFRLLAGNVSGTSAAGTMNISINPNQKKDEGDISKLDLHLSLSKATALKGPEGRSPIQQMVDQLQTLFGIYASLAPGDDKDTFVWTYYMPFVTEMQKKNFVEPFVYYVSQRTDLVGVREWLTVNRERVLAFLAWARAYSFPKVSA